MGNDGTNVHEGSQCSYVILALSRRYQPGLKEVSVRPVSNYLVENLHGKENVGRSVADLRRAQRFRLPVAAREQFGVVRSYAENCAGLRLQPGDGIVPELGKITQHVSSGRRNRERIVRSREGAWRVIADSHPQLDDGVVVEHVSQRLGKGRKRVFLHVSGSDWKHFAEPQKHAEVSRGGQLKQGDFSPVLADAHPFAVESQDAGLATQRQKESFHFAEIIERGAHEYIRGKYATQVFVQLLFEQVRAQLQRTQRLLAASTTTLCEEPVPMAELMTRIQRYRTPCESRRVTPGLQKHHHHHHHYHNHLSAPVRKFRSRSASTSVPEGSMEQKLATVSEQLEQARLEPRLEPSLPAPPCPVPACPPTVW
ncbi:hypothetical protein HPB49_006931 [Dermacentor silvarum]|uniref:Uncharacterized protein n=1 Tax=Dermacentor silvarum TaxID=543639 RepID=A0ACB8DN07_DERSI|nr:hypothetical protein HPB49_006931 [Dermacentor silvarum]